MAQKWLFSDIATKKFLEFSFLRVNGFVFLLTTMFLLQFLHLLYWKMLQVDLYKVIITP